MVEYRVLKTILLGYLDPQDDEQRDLLIPPGATIRFDGRNILFQRRDGQKLESITVNYAIEAWVMNGSLKKIEP